MNGQIEKYIIYKVWPFLKTFIKRGFCEISPKTIFKSYPDAN